MLKKRSETTILLIDGLTMIREGLRCMVLNLPGFEVVGEDGNVGNALALSAELEPDIMIMGISESDPALIEAIREVVGRQPRTKVILNLRVMNRDFLGAVLRSGASAYLAIDSPFDELARAVRIAMKGQTYITPAITRIVIDGYLTQQTGQSPNNGLTYRETEVLKAICDGENMREIALRLRVSVKTVETHRRRMMEKLGVYTVASLIKYAIREGITSL